MAVQITTAYSGDVLNKILVKATTGNEIVSRGLVNIVPNVNDKYHIPRMKTGNMLQKYKEQPKQTDSKGNFSIDEKKLEPKELMAFTLFNPRSFEHIWKPFQPSGELNFKQLPQSVQSTLLEEMAKVVDFELGYHFINGVEGNQEGQYFDGLLTRMLADNEVLNPDKSKLSADAGMIEKLYAVYKSIPKVIRSHKGLRLLMSVEDADAYDDELTALPNKGADPTSTNAKRFKGVNIEALADWPSGVIVATVTGMDLTSNLWVAVNVVNDASSIKIGLYENAGELYFFKMLMKIDTNIAFGEEVVLLDTRVVEPVVPAKFAFAGEGTPLNGLLSAEDIKPKKETKPKVQKVSVESASTGELDSPKSETGEADGLEAGTLEANPADENK
jgi:hypothetical protein